MEVIIVNPYKPKEKTKEMQKRVEFQPIYDMILAEAKEDGCIWIPYEVTEEENRRKKEAAARDNTEEVKSNLTPSSKPNDPINVDDEREQKSTNFNKLLGD